MAYYSMVNTLIRGQKNKNYEIFEEKIYFKINKITKSISKKIIPFIK